MVMPRKGPPAEPVHPVLIRDFPILLHEAAKEAARLQGQSFKEFIVNAVRNELEAIITANGG